MNLIVEQVITKGKDSGDMRFIISVLLLALLVGCNLSNRNKIASDDQLMRNFQSHEADFNKLIRMADEDAKVVRIANDFTWLDNNLNWPRPESELGFTRQRWDEYRSLFNKLNLKDGISRREDIPKTIFLGASSVGAIMRGTEKGYAYVSNEPAPIVDDLDHLSIKLNGMVPVYKRLKDNWYIYYQTSG